MECEKHELQYVKKSKIDGSLMVKKQCLSCGESAPGMFKYSDIGGKDKIHGLSFFDDELQNEYYRIRQKENLEAFNEQRNKEREEWFIVYNEYLNSEKWKTKRLLVLKRDNNLCQACLSSPATEIHHLSYKHVFNEPLFELISVCNRCHNKITELDRK